MPSSRYLIIHGHFYQPPRENPWILAIEPQMSAAPFNDWNQRIDRECYAPNGWARLLDGKGLIGQLVNNYEHLSFNFGPTLLSWMEKAAPETYRRLILADRQAAAAHGGHGSALAQVYNHIIMPLASHRDRLTQIRWGLIDFESRFGRRPEGMWLAEAAVDLETLAMLAREGLKFTILSQGQAGAVRPLAGGRDGAWQDVNGGCIDPREPYRVFWGQNPSDYIDIFFYDGPVSRSIAFDRLLGDGQTLLHRIEEAFGRPNDDGRPRLVNLATDGESYGHHFKFGEMALAWVFNHLGETACQPEAIQLTNYGHYLELFPPVKEARIIDNTSWSCIHGLERWRSDCGCNTGGGDGTWNQKWRQPLRDGLNWLRDQLAEIFEREGGPLLKDPWAARDEYIRLLIAGYQPPARIQFLARHQARPLTPDEVTRALSLLESQLMSLYMFTSCAWFFDEISGLEPVQNMRYACRAMELAQPFAAADLTLGFQSYLKTIVPNNPEYATGLDLWPKLVASGKLDGRALTAHWAAADLLNAPELLQRFVLPRFKTVSVTRLSQERLKIMAAQLELDDPRLARIDRHLLLAVYSGNAHLAILVDKGNGPGEPPGWMDEARLTELLGERFKTPDDLGFWDFLLELMPNTFLYTLEDLLPHCRASLLTTLIEESCHELKGHARDIFHQNLPLLAMNRGAGEPTTWLEKFIFQVMAETEFQRLLTSVDLSRPVNLSALGALLDRWRSLGLSQDDPQVSELVHTFISKIFQALPQTQDPGPLLAELAAFVATVKKSGYSFEIWEAQNKWADLNKLEPFTAGLSAEARDLMRQLGLTLGFSPEY